MVPCSMRPSSGDVHASNMIRINDSSSEYAMSALVLATYSNLSEVPIQAFSSLTLDWYARVICGSGHYPAHELMAFFVAAPGSIAHSF